MARTARVLRTLWLTTAVMVVVTAVLLTVTRLLLPLAENFREDLATWASQALGHPVEVGHISARWHRWGPELALFDVRLSDSVDGPVLLRFDEVHIGVDLFTALREQRLQPSAIRVIGTRVTLERMSDGRVQLQGLGIGEGGDGGNRAAGVAWLFSRQHLLLEKADLTLIDRRRDPATLELSDINLELRNAGDHHQLAGRLQLPESLGHRLTLSLDARNLVASPDAWDARLHVRLDGVQMTALTPQLRKIAPEFAAGTGNLELWGELRQGRIETLLGRLGIVGLVAQSTTEARYQIDELKADFVWRHRDAGWDLRGSNVGVARAGMHWPVGGFQVGYRAAQAESSASITAQWDYLRIEDLTPLLGAAPAIPERWRELITQLAPSGAVTAAQLQAELDEQPRFRFWADFDELGFQPWNKVPGIQGLSARVIADETSGRAQIEANNLRVDAPRLFRTPFGAEVVNAALEWSRVGEGWGVAVRRAALSDPVVKARAAMDIEWQPEGGTFLDLRAAFFDADGSHTSTYLPAGIMPKNTVAWLDRGIVAGRVPRGDLVYRGVVKRFPFVAQEGRFHVRFDAQGAVLDYQAGWPRIEGIGAAVEFEEAAMRIDAHQGETLGAKIVQASAEIPNLKRNPALTVDGKIEFPVASGIRFLRESPLSEGFREHLAGIKAGGAVSLDLGLNIPLRKGTQPAVVGTAELKGARLLSDALPSAVEGLRGRLRFTEALLTSDGLQGRILGGEAQIEIAAPLGKFRAKRPAGTVKARGRAQGAELAALLQHPALGKRLSGQARWEAIWRLPRNTGGASEFDVNSTLQGLAIDLPQPAGKTPSEERPLSISIELAPGSRTDVAVRYNDRIDARLRLLNHAKGWALERGEVRLGGARARLPGEAGLTVAGDVEQLAIAEWRAALGGWGREWNLSGGALRRIVLRIGTLLVARQQIRDIRLAVVKDNDYWEGSVNGAGAKGHLRVPVRAGDNPVLLRFDHLQLARDPLAAPEEDGVWPDPQRTSSIDITVTELQLNGEALGKLALRTTRVKGGMRIARFLVQGENLQFDASGEWMGDARASRSAINMRLESASLGRLLKALDYAEGVKNGRTIAEAQLTWPGPPGNPDMQGMTGRIALIINGGRLVDIDPGAGRIFGLLSFQALPRRLIFDFRDFFLKGFSFDEIKGDFRINSGDAYSDNLRVEGPAASIEIIGRTGLAQRDYDQLVTVIPNVTGGLPLAGWAAGGPAVGAVMLFFQKMFGKKIDESSGFRYRVTGSWDDPQLEKLTPPGAADQADAQR